MNINIHSGGSVVQKTITPDNSILVPKGHPIPFVILEDLSSEETVKGDQIEIEVAKDVLVSRMLVFKKGSKGALTVKSVKPARNLGKGGYIIFTRGYLRDTTGTLREISFRKKYSGKRCQWAAVIGHAMIWNPIGWIVAIKEGEPIYIESGAEGVAKKRKEFKIKPTL